MPLPMESARPGKWTPARRTKNPSHPGRVQSTVSTYETRLLDAPHLKNFLKMKNKSKRMGKISLSLQVPRPWPLDGRTDPSLTLWVTVWHDRARSSISYEVEVTLHSTLLSHRSGFSSMNGGNWFFLTGKRSVILDYVFDAVLLGSELNLELLKFKC